MTGNGRDSDMRPTTLADVAETVGGVALSIPGPWTDRAALVAAIAEASDGDVVAAGGLITATGAASCNGLFDLFEADSALVQAMGAGSGGALAGDDIARLSGHRTICGLTLLVQDRAHDETARQLRLLTRAVAGAGGLGVFVDRSGVAHPWERWWSLLEREDFSGLYFGTVIHIGDDHELASVGMHQYGWPDVAVSTHDAPGNDAANLIAQFNSFQLIDRPQMTAGETFATGPDAPVFQLNHAADTRYPDTHPYHNRHGLWRLEPIDAEMER